jgi:MFS family permease
VAEVSTPQNRGRLMSLYQTGFLLGISMGPAVGGICAALFGLASPFFLVGIVSMFSGIWTIARIPASVARGPGAGQPKQAGSVGAQASKPAQPYLFSAGFIAISLIALATFFTRGGALFNLWPLLSTERYGLGPGAIGALFMIPSVVNLALQPFVGTLADRLGRKVMLAPTMFLFSAGLAISALVPYLWAFAIGLALYGIAQAVEGPTANSYVADTAPPQQRAMALSVFRTVADVGLMVGSPGLGLIADTQGLNAGLLANAAVVLGPGVLFLLVAKDSVPRKAPQTAAAGSGGGQRG